MRLAVSALLAGILIASSPGVARADPAAPAGLSAVPASTGSVQGRLLGPDGAPAGGVTVALPDTNLRSETDGQGCFQFSGVPSGLHALVAAGPGFRTLRMSGLQVVAGRTLVLETQSLDAAEETIRLDPYVVEERQRRLGATARGEALLIPRTAAGDLDLPRNQDGALPYHIYNREQVERSGVINLNSFLQRELLDSDAATQPPEASGAAGAFATGSSNLNLRGFGSDATVILLNGRRLPETPPLPDSSTLGAPDLNFIPLSLVQQIEVLPVSASALYSGNAIGGVVNIVLRPDLDTTEVSSTYTNALSHYDAPQSTLSLQDGRTLLDGRLRVRLNVNLAHSSPPTKEDLGYVASADADTIPTANPVYGATPNVRSADGSPLFGAGSPAVTSVAPGANGSGGLSAFAGREGVRNTGLYAPPEAGFATSPNCLHDPFGRTEDRRAAFVSFTFDALPSLQLGADAVASWTTIDRGFDVFTGDLTLPASSPNNPFGRDVRVSLNEFAPALGEHYSEARINFASLVLAALLRLPHEWRLTFDTQATVTETRFRGLVGVDQNRWQTLVDQGAYNPLRDTQVFGPPKAFYDDVLIYRGQRGEFASLGEYQTYDGALRLTNQSLVLPTGQGTLALGVDYRRNTLLPHTDTATYADGTPAQDPVPWTGRTLNRYSFFGELQAPLLPSRWLPAGVRGVETDFGARYTAANSGAEANLSPTGGVKLSLAHGLALRASVATANRFPTPDMGTIGTLGDDPTPGAGPVEYDTIYDPLRNESYVVASRTAPNRGLRAESAVTRTFGVVAEVGQVHRLRTSLDYVTTVKAFELIFLDPQTAADLESIWPLRVVRAPLAPGDPHAVGRITDITTGVVNVASRRSENWSLTVDYAWTQCFQGTLELYGRWIGYQRYSRQVLPSSPVVNELQDPDGTAGGLIAQRAAFGGDWSNQTVCVGIDGRYYGQRKLPAFERPAQGGDHVAPYTQFDGYVQVELRRLLPWLTDREGLRVQVRVDNLLGARYPAYADDPSGAGVQAYGDWRGRTYSLSFTATY